MGISRFRHSSATVAFGSITGSFASLVAAASEVVAVVLSNATDASIDVSLDASNFFIAVPPGQAIVVPLGDADVCATVSVDVRHQGVAPTVRGFSAALIRKRI